MATMNMIQALNSAMDVMLARDPNVLIFGEDVGFSAACSGHRRAAEEARRARVFDTPIAEGGIMAVAVGMGAYGLRPVVEIQFADYIYPATDQLVSEAARLRYRSAGEFWAPITVRTPCGGGIFGGQTHSQSPEAMFAHVCGLKTVMPSNPYDAKGLLISGDRGRRPGRVPRAQALYNGPFDGHHDRPGAVVASIRRARCRRATTPCRSARRRSCARGSAVTVLAYGTMVHVALARPRKPASTPK
jgi:2-oxoisovalerate dehydrogenase E1 component beta subunit